MGKNIKRGQPGNAGQFAPSRTGINAPTTQPVTAPTSSPESTSPNYDQQYAQLHGPAGRTPMRDILAIQGLLDCHGCHIGAPAGSF